MRRVSPNRGQHSDSVVIYDAEEDLSHKCCICFKDIPTLINPCQCNILYHQHCLLLYIKEKLEGMRSELDLTLIRCHRCRKQLKFFYIENTHWGCIKHRTWCSKILLIAIILFTAIIILAVFLVQLEDSQNYWAILAVECFLSLFFLVSLAHCIQRNFSYK